MARRPLVSAVIICSLLIMLFGGAIALTAWLRGEELRGLKNFASQKIGVLPITGFISNVGPVLLTLERYRSDSSIKAILLRVDSPGGGVAACQEIYREIERINRQKPVLASMGAVAASGGYYVSAPCSHIMANRGTLTGSLGVIMGIPNLKKLMDKIGIEMQIIKSGALKDMGSSNRPLTPEERAMFQSVSDDIHLQFIEDVAKGRGMSVEEVKKLADGSIMSGRQAKKVGLVDSLGNFEDAVRNAARLCGIKGKPTLVWPKDSNKSWLTTLLESETRALVRVMKEELSASAGSQVPAYLYRPYPSQ